MTASAFLSTQLFKVFEDAADDITWITLPLYVFVFSMSTMLVLGGCIGFVMGKRQRCRHIFSAEKDGAREVNETSTSGYHDDPDKDCDDKVLDFYGMSQNDEKAEEDEEDLDGPTMVLRGSLDLMASKWGTDGKKNETRLQRRGSENECKQISSSASKRSSAVVEYLSPERMSELLFSKVNCDGSNVGTTLCLDEYDPSRSSCNDTYSDSDEDEDITPSPKSSAIDIVSLLSPVGKSFNKSSNKSISTKEGKEGEDSTAKGSTAATLTPSAFIHLLSQIQRYSVDTSHPYFFNQLFGSLDPIALAAEIVALSVNTSVYTYETAPVFTLMEREVMGQIGKLVFGRKNEQEEEEEEFEGEGLMIPGGSLANLTAMHAARHRWKVMNGYTQKDGSTSTASETLDDEYYSSGMEQEEEKKMEDPDPLPLSREDEGHALEQSQQSVAHLYNYDRASTTPDLVAFVSSEAHYSFAKSARVLGLRKRGMRRWRMAAAAVVVLLLVVGGTLWWRPWAPQSTELPDQPSLAVLPFDNFSGDPALNYFADGFSEDIITTLSRFPDLAVISRNSSFVYKGKATDIRQIGKELGVAYVLEGSVRKQGDKLRLTAQLIDAANGEHVWAERYDEEGTDPWALQDDVISKIVASLTGEEGHLKQAEYKRTWGKDSGSLEEYDYYLRGHELFITAETEDVLEQAGAAWSEGLRKFPNSSLLRVKLALYHLMFVWRYWSDDPAADIRQAEQFVQEARSLPAMTPQARRLGHWGMAWAQQMKGDLSGALEEAKAAIALAPYDSYMVGDLAAIIAMAGEPGDAVTMLEDIRSRSPNFHDHWALTVAYYLVGDDESAIETALEYRRNSLDRYVLLASSYVRLGQMDEARAAIETLLELDPRFTQEDLKENYLYSDPTILERQAADLGKAGLPDK